MAYLVLCQALDTILVYRPPQVNVSYDIADYKSVDPRYGSLSDVDLLINLRNHDIKFMIDLVVNHTSDQHACLPSLPVPKSPRNAIGISRGQPEASTTLGIQYPRTTGRGADSERCVRRIGLA